jgi:hypothetical protein
MRYYLNTSTQEKKDEGYTEYGKKETKGTGESAKTNAISDLHAAYATMLKTAAIQYWVGKVEDTKGNVIDKCECGEYVDVPETPAQ